MTVTYAPPLTGAPAEYGMSLTHEAITDGPAYARSRQSTRWHRIRSAYRRLEHDGEIHEVYRFWCNQTTFAPHRAPIFADQLPAGEPGCGTCEGRAIGADPTHPEWLYTPWTLTKPARCPGARSRFADPLPGNRTATCLACRLVIPIRACGSRYNPDWCIADHAPGPRLPAGCEFHAWDALTVIDGRAVCRCKVVP